MNLTSSLTSSLGMCCLTINTLLSLNLLVNMSNGDRCVSTPLLKYKLCDERSGKEGGKVGAICRGDGPEGARSADVGLHFICGRDTFSAMTGASDSVLIIMGLKLSHSSWGLKNSVFLMGMMSAALGGVIEVGGGGADDFALLVFTVTGTGMVAMAADAGELSRGLLQGLMLVGGVAVEDSTWVGAAARFNCLFSEPGAEGVSSGAGVMGNGLCNRSSKVLPFSFSLTTV